jgi:HK97 family phage prohead protease
MSNAATLLAELEKSALAGDPMARQVLEHPITELLLKELVDSPVPAYIRFDVPAAGLLLKDGKRRIIHGYASVEVIDKQNELVTIPALQKAWDRMKAAGEKYANINLEHSNITIGKILLKETVEDSEGKKYWSHVDDKGLYVVAELRDDIEIADKVWEMANKGELNAFSIGGRALGGKTLVAQARSGAFWKIDDLELYEITVCKRGKNTESGFQVLKSYLDHGLITEEMFLQKSAELKNSEKLVKELSFLPNLMGKSLIIRKEFVCQVGSSVEKGEGNDFDLLIKMDTDNPMRRHVETRILKALPNELWDKLEFIFGDEGGPHDAYRPLFDLALVPCDSLGKIDMIKAETSQSGEPSSAQSNITLKNIEGRTSTTEDSKMSEKVEKTIGTPGVVGTGTGPNTGGVTGTSATGPNIATMRSKIKELEAMLPSEGKEGAVKAEVKPGEEEKPEKEAAKPEEEKPEGAVKEGAAKDAGCKAGKYPLPGEKEGAAKADAKPGEEEDEEEDAKDAAGKTKLPYPPEDEKMLNDPEVISTLEGLEAKGKMPPGLKRYIEEHRKKSDSQRIADIGKAVAELTKAVATLQKSATAVDVDGIAKKTADILKSQSATVRKSAFTGDNAPETPGTPGAAAPGQPLTLQTLHELPWTKVHDVSDQQRAARLRESA